MNNENNNYNGQNYTEQNIHSFRNNISDSSDYTYPDDIVSLSNSSKTKYIAIGSGILIICLIVCLIIFSDKDNNTSDVVDSNESSTVIPSNINDTYSSNELALNGAAVDLDVENSSVYQTNTYNTTTNLSNNVSSKSTTSSNIQASNKNVTNTTSTTNKNTTSTADKSTTSNNTISNITSNSISNSTTNSNNNITQTMVPIATNKPSTITTPLSTLAPTSNSKIIKTEEVVAQVTTFNLSKKGNTIRITLTGTPYVIAEGLFGYNDVGNNRFLYDNWRIKLNSVGRGELVLALNSNVTLYEWHMTKMTLEGKSGATLSCKPTSYRVE